MTATREKGLLAILTAALLLPFVGKAFHMDDPLFLWSARQIRAHPLDFYGFDVNWYGWRMPMSEVTKNPPLASYYIALASLIGGFREVTLHVAFLIPALAAAAGIHALAARLSARPVLATLAAVLTPAFIVCSTSLMCDTMLLAFWVWAVVLWHRGAVEHRMGDGWAAGLLVAAAGLTKYYGVALIPLFAIDALVRRRRVWPRLACLLLPVSIFALYQAGTSVLYGRGLLMDAATYASQWRPPTGPLGSSLLAGLAFTGGCFAAAGLLELVTGAWLARLGAIAGTVAFVLLARCGALGSEAMTRTQPWPVALQLVLLGAAGLLILARGTVDGARQRDPDTVLLVLWLLGTFLFTAVLNWTASARALLPGAPAAAILFARRRDALHLPSRRTIATALAVAGALSLAVARADWYLARAGRRAAERIGGRLASGPRPLWFEGHWGFQYYMESFGAQALDRRDAHLEAGDLFVSPANATNLEGLPPDAVTAVGFVEERLPTGLAVMSMEAGAGFHSDVWGPLPFAVGPVPPESYAILKAQRPIASRPR